MICNITVFIRSWSLFQTFDFPFFLWDWNASFSAVSTSFNFKLGLQKFTYLYYHFTKLHVIIQPDLEVIVLFALAFNPAELTMVGRGSTGTQITKKQSKSCTDESWTAQKRRPQCLDLESCSTCSQTRSLLQRLGDCDGQCSGTQWSGSKTCVQLILSGVQMLIIAFNLV